MVLALPCHTSPHDGLPVPVPALEGATSYWASAVANPPGHMSHHGARGTGGRWSLPMGRPAWSAYDLGRPDVLEGTGWMAPFRHRRARVAPSQITTGEPSAMQVASIGL